MAHEAQQNFFREVKLRFPKYFTDVKVLDIGSLDINGNTRHFFSHPFSYCGVDLALGNNVDVACPGHLFESSYQFDVVMSGECFEHDLYYGRTILNMIKLLKPKGLMIFTCASTGRPEHGTLRTSPDNAPFLAGMSEKWANYYKNLTEDDIRCFLDVDGIFEDYYFQESHCGHIGNDLYFWGIKR